MNLIVQTTALPALIDRAASALVNARSAAEILEVREMASFAYDAAKKAARLGKAKQAHDDLIKTAYRVQADALEIEAGAKRRLADEYDAAQERKEIKANGGARNFTVPDENSELPSAADIGLTRKEIHEARVIRDAEEIDPGIVRRTVDAAVAAGEEPSKAKVRRVVYETARPQAARPAPARGKDAVRERVLEAIMILSGLPPAHEVVGYFAGTDNAIIISERIHPAANWFADFSNAWKDEQC